MSRKDKVNAIKRYLVAYTGLPLISWDGKSNDLDAVYPYEFSVSTDRSNNRFIQIARGLPEKKISAVIRYDKEIDNINKALVIVTLETYVQLVASHYESNSRPIEGE